MLRLRDRLLPLVNLAELLAARRRPREPTAAPTSSWPRSARHVFGIIVDRVFDTEEIVVKPVAPILRHITMFSGNTILGDGWVIMILDPNGIARATGDRRRGERRAGAMQAAAGAPAALERPTAMLLFRAGGGQPNAVPLGLVARLEDIPRERIEASAGRRSRSTAAS